MSTNTKPLLHMSRPLILTGKHVTTPNLFANPYLASCYLPHSHCHHSLLHLCLPVFSVCCSGHHFTSRFLILTGKHIITPNSFANPYLSSHCLPCPHHTYHSFLYTVSSMQLAYILYHIMHHLLVDSQYYFTDSFLNLHRKSIVELSEIICINPEVL